MYTYTAVFSYEDNGATIKFPMFDIEMYEETDDEVLAAKEILTLEIANYLDNNKPLPSNEFVATETDKVVDITVIEDDLKSVVNVMESEE